MLLATETVWNAVEVQLCSVPNVNLDSGRYSTDNVKNVLKTVLLTVIMIPDIVTAAWMGITSEKTRCNVSCVLRIVYVVTEKGSAWSVKKREL